MEKTYQKPTIEIPIHGPQAIAYLCGSAISEAGISEEEEKKYFEKIEQVGWHRKRAILDIARKYVNVEFSETELKGPDGKPKIKITAEDDMGEVRRKTTSASEKAGAENRYVVNFMFETAFCKNREEVKNVCENYVQIS